MNDYGIKVGDKVQCGVHVLGEWKPTSVGVVVSQTVDGSVSGVDVMSLHGGAPWVRQEATIHLRRVPTVADLALDGMMARDSWPEFMTPNVGAKLETTAPAQN